MSLKMRGKNRNSKKFVKPPILESHPRAVVVTKNPNPAKLKTPTRKVVLKNPNPQPNPQPKPIVATRKKKKKFSRKRKRRGSLKKLIKRVPMVGYILGRLCQLQYLRAYSYRINRFRWGRWPILINNKTLRLLANAKSERRHATRAGENLFMGLNPIWLVKTLKFWRPPFLATVPYPRTFALKYVFKKLKTRKKLKELKEFSEDKSFLFTHFKRKTAYVFSCTTLPRNFLFWFKRRRRCRVFVPLKNCLGFRRGGLLLLSRQFKLGTLFTNYLTIARKYIIYTKLIRQFKIVRLSCFFRVMFYRNKKKTCFKVLKKKKKSKYLRRLTLFFTTEIFHLFKLQHGLVRTKLHHYKILKESDVVDTFRINLTKRFLAFWSTCNQDAYFRQLSFIRTALKVLQQREKKKILKRNIRPWRKNNLAFTLCRRLVKLLTKRGGRLRAYRSLESLLYALKPSRRQSSLAKKKMIFKKKRKRFRSPVLLALRKLRTYFFLRKFTKSRKTLLIPGILPKRRRLRVAARWLVAAAKKGAERTLRDRLFTAITQASTGRGSAKQMQITFNKTVKVSKVNLRTYNRRRRRFFFRRPRPKLKSWKHIFRVLNHTGKSKSLLRYFRIRKLRQLWWRKKRWGNKALSKKQHRLLDATTTADSKKFELKLKKKKKRYRKKKYYRKRRFFR